jgi:flagellar basal body-associated protein FliL
MGRDRDKDKEKEKEKDEKPGRERGREREKPDKREELDVSEVDEGEGAAKPEPGRLSRFLRIGERVRRILMYVLIALLVVGISVTVTWFVTRLSQRQAPRPSGPGVLENTPPYNTFVLYTDMQLKTADTDTDHMVTMDVVLAFEAEKLELPTELGARKYQFQSLAYDFFSSRKFQELSDLQQRKRLLQELLTRMNQLLTSPEKLKDIYLPKFVAM